MRIINPNAIKQETKQTKENHGPPGQGPSVMIGEKWWWMTTAYGMGE